MDLGSNLVTYEISTISYDGYEKSGEKEFGGRGEGYIAVYR